MCITNPSKASAYLAPCKVNLKEAEIDFSNHSCLKGRFTKKRPDYCFLKTSLCQDIILCPPPLAGKHMLCLKTADLLKSQKPVINEIKKLFKGVKGYRSTSPNRAHITLFRGFESSPKFTRELQKKLLNQIALRLTRIEPFEIEVSPKTARIKISEKYVIIKINNDSLKNLQKKIQKISQDFVIENHLDIDEEWFDKTYFPHMTLTQIDRHCKESQFPQELRKQEKNLQSKINSTKIKINAVSLVNVMGHKNPHNVVGSVSLGDSINLNEKRKQHLR